MSQIIIKEKVAPVLINADEQQKKPFGGYTMEELRYQKALAAVRKEFCKSNVKQAFANMRKPPENSVITKALPFISSVSDKVARVTEKHPVVRSTGSAVMMVAKTLVGRAKPLNYVMLGISLISPVCKIVKSLKRKK